MTLKNVLSIVAICIAIAGFNAYRDGHLNSLLGQGAKLSGGPGAAKQRTSNDLLPPDARALSDKLQPFVVCINRVDQMMQQNIAAYRSDLKAIAANQKSPQFVGIDRFRSFKIAPFEQANSFSLECSAGLEKAAGAAPKDEELDAVARGYASTVRALIPLMNDADLYYGQKDYADDKLAKGKTLDAAMSPLFDRLLAHSAVMRKTVGQRNDGLRVVELGAIEKARGRNIDWHTLNIMVTARKAMQGVETATEARQPSREGVSAAEALLQKAFDDAKIIAATVKLPAEGSGERKPIWFDIEPSAATFLGSIKELRREIEANKPAASLAYNIQSVTRSYNSLIESHNRRARF